MTKAELQKQNDYLLLQLKIINQLTEEITTRELAEIIGAISYYSNSQTIKDNLDFIKEYNENYNFYNQTMNIDDYKI